jgi:hypothetical protein
VSCQIKLDLGNNGWAQIRATVYRDWRRLSFVSADVNTIDFSRTTCTFVLNDSSMCIYRRRSKTEFDEVPDVAVCLVTVTWSDEAGVANTDLSVALIWPEKKDVTGGRTQLHNENSGIYFIRVIL